MNYLHGVHPFYRNQNLHISQTPNLASGIAVPFCRNQNLHISQTNQGKARKIFLFCRNQNLHISQTTLKLPLPFQRFVEIKIYISLKLID